MEERPKLYRSRTNKILGGVCAGLGNYLNLDPVLIRIIFVVLTIFAGGGLLVYIILWIVIPEEPIFIQQNISSESQSQQENYIRTEKIQSTNGSGRMVFGVLLVIIGLLFLFEAIFDVLTFEYIGPIILILIGGSLIYNSIQKKELK